MASGSRTLLRQGSPAGSVGDTDEPVSRSLYWPNAEIPFHLRFSQLAVRAADFSLCNSVPVVACNISLFQEHAAAGETQFPKRTYLYAANLPLHV